MDVGSTAIKWCVAPGVGRLGAVSHERRRPDVPVGEQATAIADRYPGLPLRVCSSAGEGLRVGLLGLTGRYSLIAGRRAVLAAGCRLSYADELGKARSADPETPDPVEVLVLVGGTDRGDHRHLVSALADFRPTDRPHATLVWAGAAGAALDLRPQHRVTNVHDDQLRPTPAGLTALLRHLHGGIDSVARPELEILAGRLDGPIVPTSLAVRLAVDELVTDRQPVLAIDVGGTSTDLHYRRGPFPAVMSIRQSFPELGVARSRVALAARIAGEPLLYEFIDAIAPADPRALYQRLRDADQDALAAPVGFLACLFATVGELGNAVPELPTTGREPTCANLDLAGAKVVVTGGACTDVPLAAIARVLDAATGQPASRRSVTVDTDYQLWARGLGNLT
jgi:MutL protein